MAKDGLKRLEELKSKFNSLNSNPLMDIEGDGSTIESKLSREKSSYDSYVSQNDSLSSQLSQAQNDLANKQSTLSSTQYNLSNLQSTLTSKQNNLATLQTKLNGQQALVRKIQSYLSDYQENPTSSTGTIDNEQLAKNLIGELAQLNLE